MHICSYMHKEKMMLSESDLYNSNTSPDVKVNPKSLGAMWINYSNGRHYICKDNTNNKNVWLDPIGVLTNEINTNVKNEITKITEKVNNIKSLGYNQDWYYAGNTIDPSLNIVRHIGVWYQNDTDAPIAVWASSGPHPSSGAILEMWVGEDPKRGIRITFDTSITYGGHHGNAIGFSIVPPSHYYSVWCNVYLLHWSELR